MTARARYQRIPAFFWSEDSNAIYLLHLTEEHDACMSALSVACVLFFLLRGTGQVGSSWLLMVENLAGPRPWPFALRPGKLRERGTRSLYSDNLQPLRRWEARH